MGWTRSNTSFLPPTMMEMVRLSTLGWEPEMGASSISMPWARSFPASSACQLGYMVLISTWMRPFFFAAAALGAEGVLLDVLGLEEDGEGDIGIFRHFFGRG